MLLLGIYYKLGSLETVCILSLLETSRRLHHARVWVRDQGREACQK